MVEKSHKKSIGFSVLPPEEILIDTQYTLTVNIADLHGQFDIDHSRLYHYAQRYLKGVAGLEYRLYPEYSKRGRLHLHGIIEFKKEISIMCFYDNMMDMLSKSSIEIDTISEMQKWSEYIVKQEKYMRRYCEKKHVIYEFTRDSVQPMETPRSKTSIEKWL